MSMSVLSACVCLCVETMAGWGMGAVWERSVTPTPSAYIGSRFEAWGLDWGRRRAKGGRLPSFLAFTYPLDRPCTTHHSRVPYHTIARLKRYDR